MPHAHTLVHAGFVLALASAAGAQPLGTFRWQLQPYCNLIAMSVVQEGGVYRLEGTDDQCGNGRDLASVTGLAFLNPDGTIGFGLTVVTTPGGAPVHIDAEVTLPGLSGSWRDSTGATGTFALSPNRASGGSPRPAVPLVLPATVVLLENGTAPSTTGSRLLWHGERRAFRAGQAENGNWSETNLGYFSAAFGRSTRASGEFAFSTGCDPPHGPDGAGLPRRLRAG
ncbi:MAG: hypothetical protein IT177_21490 [Acidobacteria bacterium]|nr:hypothetical protein [Acidobacteriota bacterium]